MKVKSFLILSVILVISTVFGYYSAAQTISPANPNATPEARALLKYMQEISGKYILSGQHNFPASGERNTLFASEYIGKTPVIWSQDFGFARDGDKDSYLSRPAIIREAIDQHRKGAIITFCWHAVPPTANEPVTFQPLPGTDPNTPLASVQGKLTDKQFQDILTPGTELYKNWIKQVDEISSFLKQLQDANVPVLWRPYHEMNGDWFWWGGRYEGKYTTAALYKQIFDRMVKFHKLNNLVWIWSVDRPSQPGREFNRYYPGTKYLDILAIDIYGNDFNQAYYEGLLALSEGKPVVLGEVGNPPSPEIMDKQSKWAYWVVWAGMTRGTSTADYQKLLNYPGALFIEDEAYISGTREYRLSCGLDPVSIDIAADFTGEWKLNECESQISQGRGGGATPYKLSVIQKGNTLNIKSYTISEYSDDDVAEQTLTLDGKENVSKTFMNAPRVQTANWSGRRDTLAIDSRVTTTYQGKTSEMKSMEVWTLRKKGKKLAIIQTSPGFGGGPGRTNNLVYDRQ